MPPWRSAWPARSVSVGGATIAEGIAVRDIGEMPFEIVRRRIAGILVDCRSAPIEEAIGLLVEAAKTVAEGAGAAGLAALLAYPERFRGKQVGVAITGGNIDARILSNVLLRDLLRDGRLLRLHLQIPDRPGVLADIAGKIGGSRRQHHRSIAPAPVSPSSSVQAAELEVMVEARDKQHANAIVAALEETYIVRRV